jgi:glucokinase
VTLIGAGTGLGVALLTGSTAQGWHVVPTEGGHASFAPTDDEERKIAAWLGIRHGRVSTERLLSGHGLSNIDACLRGIDPTLAPAAQADSRRSKDVVEAALAGETEAVHALRRFCRIYGAVAGDAALLHGANNVMIAGGVVLHFLDFFRSSDFMTAFTAKGRHADYMRRMAVQVVTHPNPGLLGAAVAVRAAAATA